MVSSVLKTIDIENIVTLEFLLFFNQVIQKYYGIESISRPRGLKRFAVVMSLNDFVVWKSKNTY